MPHKFVLCCVLLLTLGLSSALFAETRSTTLQTTEGHVLAIQELDIIRGYPQLAGESFTVDVEVQASHGDLWPTDTGWEYQSKGDYVGFDRATFRISLEKSGESFLKDVTIRVLPEALPIVGTFYPTGHAAFGRYFQDRGAFQLCDPWTTTVEMLATAIEESTTATEVLQCQVFPVQNASPGWLPIYGDWDGTGWNNPSLFDPTTGTLFQLTFKKRKYEITRATPLKGMSWAWPVAGDWNGDGAHQLVLVKSNGRPYLFRELSSDITGEAWNDSLPMPADDRFPWPVLRLNEEAPDALAIIDGNILRWIYQSPKNGSVEKIGSTSDSIELNYDQELSVPIHGRAVALLHSNHLYTLTRDSHGQEIKAVVPVNRPFPSTLPLTFPHEPPGG